MLVTAIIETPGGSQQKYYYDKETGFFKLKKILPEGMMFPFDFGFVPGTLGEDGDPLDIIVIAEFTSFPGCMIECRLLGAIKATQQKKGKKIRNDRLIAVPAESKLFGTARSLRDIPRKILSEIKSFFINYNKLEGKTFTPIATLNDTAAWKLIEASQASK